MAFCLKLIQKLMIFSKNSHFLAQKLPFLGGLACTVLLFFLPTNGLQAEELVSPVLPPQVELLPPLVLIDGIESEIATSTKSISKKQNSSQGLHTSQKPSLGTKTAILDQNQKESKERIARGEGESNLALCPPSGLLFRNLSMPCAKSPWKSTTLRSANGWISSWLPVRRISPYPLSMTWCPTPSISTPRSSQSLLPNTPDIMSIWPRGTLSSAHSWILLPKMGERAMIYLLKPPSHRPKSLSLAVVPPSSLKNQNQYGKLWSPV